MNSLQTPLIVDSHEDLAWNILTFARDYTKNSQQIRQIEKNTQNALHNGDSLLGWDDYQKANVGIIFSTLFAAPISTKEGEWDHQTYATQKEAYRLYRNQMDVYFRLTDEHPDKFRLLQTRNDLSRIIEDREKTVLPDKPVIGLLPLMEGADGIQRPQDLAEWVELGVRLIGLAWHATHYCGGTSEPGPLTEDGFRLLKEMDDTGCVLDISHMDEKAVWQAFDAFSGRVMASHVNPNQLLLSRKSNRFLNDDVIQALVERKGVMGLVPYNTFLDANWTKGSKQPKTPVHYYVEQIDYVCQLVGSSDFVAIGTDYDGGFGLQDAPYEINSIADIPVIIPMLFEKGYTTQDIAKIFGQNWIRFLLEVLP